MLPEIRKINPLTVFTPQKWQTVILRNYGLVSNEKLARVLRTDENTIFLEVKRLGIEKIKYNGNWLKKGYITIVRNNWQLLPYSQLLELLEMSEETLDFNLREDDFLAFKLGSFKPYCEEVVYKPLTEKEIEKTKRISKIIKDNIINNYVSPFEFGYEKRNSVVAQDKNVNFEKIIYAYSTMYGDTFLNEEQIVPKELLKKLSEKGVNGIWFQGVLSKLSHYPFLEGVSKGYEKRRENLQKLVNECALYGIKVYLYFNEPRALEQEEFSPQTEHLKGRRRKNKISLCTSKEQVQTYLYESVKDLFSKVRGLGGIITITASENLTNCYSWPGEECAVCSKRSRAEVISEVNNIMMRAVRDSNSGAKVLANLWGWRTGMGWTEEEIYKGISLLDKDVAVMCVSEFGTILNGEKQIAVSEYSISQVGPCEETKKYLKYAKQLGHKIMAKVQINNSWELSTVPFIPVYDLIIEHLVNLKNLGVNGLMLSWTLGGYPSLSLDLVNQIFSGEFSYDEWLKSAYAEKWGIVKESVNHFSSAFKNYPFSQNLVYYSPVQIGASNLWYAQKTGLKATMVCFPYDDFESWYSGFSLDEVKDKLKDLVNEWSLGLEKLENTQGNKQFEELKLVANVVWLNIKSLLVQFIYNEKKITAEKRELLSLAFEELDVTKALYKLASKDARIGYEASNHYYFTQNTFLEKFVNLHNIIENYQENLDK